MWNIIIGLVFIVGGLSGKLVLRGTNSSTALVVVGGVLLVWGIIVVVRKKPTYPVNQAMSQLPEIKDFFKFTVETWMTGILDKLDLNFKLEAQKVVKLPDLSAAYGPFEGSIMIKFFEQYKPVNGEFLIGYGDKDRDKNNDRGWFVLTNYNLFIKNGETKQYHMINLNDIDSFKISSLVFTPSVFKLKDGTTLNVPKVEVFPAENYVKFAIELAKQKTEPETNTPEAPQNNNEEIQ